MRVEVYDIDWVDENDFELSETLFRQFNLLNERDWDLSETVGIASEGDEIIGVIIGYDEVCVICQVKEVYRRQGVGSALVKASGQFYPKQNGAPDFWEAIECL